MIQPLRLGLVGLGKIARTQHLPAISADAGFELVAAADPHAVTEGLQCYNNLAEMLASSTGIDAIVLCQPPQGRFQAAREALLAGKHVFMEKPPATGITEAEMLVDLAAQDGLTLFAAWHSREAQGVQEAKRRLSDGRVHAGSIYWKEDVNVWHPGQTWIWQPGGFGVFDPGINALSILTEIIPERVHLVSADLFVPENCAVPIAARLILETASGAAIEAEFDFRQTGPQTWDIRVECGPNLVELSAGGNILHLNGTLQPSEPEQEYVRLYRRFRSLVDIGRSEVDLAPLRLVADAFLKGRWTTVAPFDPDRSGH